MNNLHLHVTKENLDRIWGIVKEFRKERPLAVTPSHRPTPDSLTKPLQESVSPPVHACLCLKGLNVQKVTPFQITLL